MERLTYKDEMGYHLKLEHEDADTVTALGLYEDTGLTPEEIESLPEAWMEKVKELGSGLLVKLPCKIGDKAWGIRNVRGTKLLMAGVVAEMYYSQEMRLIARVHGICRGEVGKTVFLTLEEAKDALEKG